MTGRSLASAAEADRCSLGPCGVGMLEETLTSTAERPARLVLRRARPRRDGVYTHPIASAAHRLQMGEAPSHFRCFRRHVAHASAEGRTSLNLGDVLAARDASERTEPPSLEC